MQQHAKLARENRDGNTSAAGEVFLLRWQLLKFWQVGVVHSNISETDVTFAELSYPLHFDIINTTNICRLYRPLSLIFTTAQSLFLTFSCLVSSKMKLGCCCSEPRYKMM